MREVINEKIVMQFYLEEIKNDEIAFLVGREKYKKEISDYISKMINAEKMNEKIKIACGLWKLLFEAAMSFIDPEKQGYDKIFSFFDEFVEFEELIFASDSFYRDHTLHCLWVYFLGEYIYKKAEYNEFLSDLKTYDDAALLLDELITKLDLQEYFGSFHEVCDAYRGIQKYNDSLRCVTSLTHDLGYPIKKITKINKSMKNILPYFSINSYNDFSFEFNNLQQHFIEYFIDFISSDLNFMIKLGSASEMEFLRDEIFEIRDNKFIDLRNNAIEHMTAEKIEAIKKNLKTECYFIKIPSQAMSFSNEFEEYHHGIMSAFLLAKNLKAFQNILYVYGDKLINTHSDFGHLVIKQLILSSVANHTRDTFRIKKIDDSTFLTFIDELEEFSRISRASQNREYVEEFCTSYIYMKDNWLNVDFVFENDSLDNLDPEIAFKGRCKRFLTLFDVPKLSDKLKIKLRCIGQLENNKNTYVLELANRHVDILVNGESVDIPKYLKSNQFYSKEEYAALGKENNHKTKNIYSMAEYTDLQ